MASGTLSGYRIHSKLVPDLDYQLPFRVGDYREASDSIKDDSDYDASDVDSDVFDDGDRPRRSHHHWDGRWDFVSAQIVYNMHLNILWRFPYMILACGGAAFVILVIILSFMFGLPMLVLEASLGQMTKVNQCHPTCCGTKVTWCHPVCTIRQFLIDGIIHDGTVVHLKRFSKINASAKFM